MGAYDLGRYAGALVIVFVIRRVVRWLFRRRLGDGLVLVLASLLATLVLAVWLGAFGFRDGGAPRFDTAIAVYGPAVLVWLLIDLLALRGRRARAREAESGIADVFAGDRSAAPQVGRNGRPVP